MGLKKEERAYYQLRITQGPPCLSEEEEAENSIEEIRQTIQANEGRYRDTLSISSLARLAFALVGEARTVEEAKALYEKSQPGSPLHHQGQNEPLAPFSLTRYRGTRPRP